MKFTLEIWIDVPLQPNTASSLGFTGELTDPTGLVYLRARTYNPTLGIFTSRDPVLGVAGLSASYNGYGYVHGNPTNYRDPSGKCVWQPGVNLISCGMENFGLLAQQGFSILQGVVQSAQREYPKGLEESWKGGVEGWAEEWIALYPDIRDFTLEVGVPMFFPPASLIVTGADMAQSWAEGTLKPIDVLLFAAGLGKFGQMATIRSVEEEIARSILRAEQRNSERIFSNDFQVDEAGRIRVGRRDGGDPGISLRQRRVWSSPQYARIASEGERFDVAFGVGEYLPDFARSFNEPKAYFYTEWPDSLIRLPEVPRGSRGPIMQLENRAFLESYMKTVLNRIREGEVPDTVIRFNLQGLTDPAKTSITMFELKHILSDGVLRGMTVFYEDMGNVLTADALRNRLRLLHLELP